MNYIIGAGGVGSFMAPALIMLTSPQSVTVIDGDKLEAKNLNRQLFTKAEIGRFKSDALATKYGCASIPKWFDSTLVRLEPEDWLFCVVDNHPARAAALSACDLFGCSAIIAANEVHSSEAYLYQPPMCDTEIDPRKYYPEILTSTSGDPRAASIGCTGEAQENNRQLVTANFMAASLALHLYVVWAMESKGLKRETLRSLPHRLSQTLTKSESFNQGRNKTIVERKQHE